MKLFRVAVLALALLGGMASAESKTKWTLYQSSGDGYSVEFPGTPTVKRDSVQSRVGPAPHVTAALDASGYSYSVQLTTYASASDPQGVLDLFADGFTKVGYVRAQTPLKIGTDIARLFEVEMEQGQVVGTMLVVTDGTRVYQVLCITLKGNEHSANVKHFIKSFALVQQ